MDRAGRGEVLADETGFDGDDSLVLEDDDAFRMLIRGEPD